MAQAVARDTGKLKRVLVGFLPQTMSAAVICGHIRMIVMSERTNFDSLNGRYMAELCPLWELLNTDMAGSGAVDSAYSAYVERFPSAKETMLSIQPR